MTALLEVHGLTRFFGPLQAVRDLSFAVRPGELVGLIGPNGAGKSTLYNLVAGALPPTSGRIILDGDDITNHRPYQVARAGIARTFQIPKPYRNLSVIENVMISALMREGSPARARELARAVLSDVNMSPYANEPVGVLTVGFLKRLEVARALALQPKLVLFDEIMAGLTPTEVNAMTKLVAGLPARGISVIWVEHVLYAIMKTAQRVMVLHRGQLIADGAPARIARDPAVVKAYLGEEMSLV
jgi:branched-chain amino acid transport system ATP-binding protein